MSLVVPQIAPNTRLGHPNTLRTTFHSNIKSSLSDRVRRSTKTTSSPVIFQTLQIRFTSPRAIAATVTTAPNSQHMLVLLLVHVRCLLQQVGQPRNYTHPSVRHSAICSQPNPHFGRSSNPSSLMSLIGHLIQHLDLHLLLRLQMSLCKDASIQ